jgi:hypothetical protein
MVHRTRYGLGDRRAAVLEFDKLLPHVLQIRALQANCRPLGPEDEALQIAVDALETAAYHFTRRRLYYEVAGVQRDYGRNYYPALGDRAEAVAAFEGLAPYWVALTRLQGQCRPFGRDYLALDIAKQGLDTAAYHFTRIDHFYAARGDSSGPVRAAV